MPVSKEDLEKVINIIADKEELKVTVSNSVKGGVTAGISTAVGGILLGPIGLAIGGAVGGTLAYMTSDDFKPVSEVVKTLDYHKKEKLLEEIRCIIGDLDFSDMFALLRYLNSDGLWLRRQVISEVMRFMQKELSLKAA